MVNPIRCSGGVRPPKRKELAGRTPIEDALVPPELVLFLSQHIGAPSKALVKAGDPVKRGQKIAELGGPVSSALHAPTSGKVKAVEPRYQPVLARMVDAIVIETDGAGQTVEGLGPVATDLESLSRDKIIEIAKEAGIVGLGGAAFPTYVKININSGRTANTYLLNGSECEPYLTADERLMQEKSDDIVFGYRALMKASGAAHGIVCVESDLPEAIKAMSAAIASYKEMELAVIPCGYPAGGEKQLIKAVLGLEVPPPPGLPIDIGVLVSNVGTAYTLGRAIRTGLPLVERVVTVSGDAISRPGNFVTLIGTPVSYLIERAGGFVGTPGKVIMGGPMMGLALRDLSVPVLKGTSGIVVMTEKQAQVDPVLPCIRCGKCVEVCPMRLLPVWMAAYADNGYLDEAEKHRVMDCCECGACTYECPSRRPLVQSIRLAKAQINERRRASALKKG